MCMVSAVMDYGRNIPKRSWTITTFNEYTEILRRLDALDKKLGEPECHDPAKAKWMKSVEDRLTKLEAPKRKPRKKAA